ncbi:alkaline-phosphatase-like protein [Naematelia encephala]|uniref:Alkaline-phosphatase-like protein n=1 Tax=Naematelia encephala TaxID=71784 RepID=A0A1Y2B9R9_9TREE|nr:alkaline-phosphatase-like protein [Naematelia encephala]
MTITLSPVPTIATELPDVSVPGLKSSVEDSRSFTLHERVYKLPASPTVVICVDGFDPEYLTQGMADGILPNLACIYTAGFCATAHAAMPTFTNPNNCSIISGAATGVHGISGNFYLDPKTGEEKLVLDDTLLQGSTILEQMSLRGVRVAAVTAKDKLRRIIQHGLNPATGDICFSSEYADRCTLRENGIDNVESYVGRTAPPQYSGDLSLFVLDAGIKLLAENRADLFYLTLSDFIQHKHAPGSKESNAFFAALDDKVGQLVRLGAVVGITGDHGMSDKSTIDGEPNVLYVQDELEARFGAGCARVVCPITDPFVRHHGALGSFVRIHLDPAFKSKRDEMIKFLESSDKVQVVLPGEEAAARWEMPLYIEGDIAVVSVKHAVLGSKASEHDLENLKGHRLRSHGGLSEQDIPIMSSSPLSKEAQAEVSERQWRNFDVFDLVLNRV